MTDFINEIKLLKEKLKKKNERIKALNKKIDSLKEDNDYNYREATEYRSKYEAVATLLPLKYYQITYRITNYRKTPPIISEKKALLIGRHPEVILTNLRIQYRAQIDLVDILEVAS